MGPRLAACRSQRTRGVLHELAPRPVPLPGEGLQQPRLLERTRRGVRLLAGAEVQPDAVVSSELDAGGVDAQRRGRNVAAALAATRLSGGEDHGPRTRAG